jgi:hypothetical protein
MTKITKWLKLIDQIYQNDTFLDFKYIKIKGQNWIPTFVMMHLLKKRFVKIPVLICTWKTYVPYETMLKRIVGSSCSSSNKINKVVNDNRNHYMSIVMDAIIRVLWCVKKPIQPKSLNC